VLKSSETVLFKTTKQLFFVLKTLLQKDYYFLFSSAMKSRISASMDSSDDISYSKAAKLAVVIAKLVMQTVHVENSGTLSAESKDEWDSVISRVSPWISQFKSDDLMSITGGLKPSEFSLQLNSYILGHGKYMNDIYQSALAVGFVS
jgi:hypothetical protein